MLRSPDYSFLRIWRCALFVSYLIVAAIVLLSLLVAVLGETVDRVVLNREAELIKCRAIFAGRRIYSARLLDMLFGFRSVYQMLYAPHPFPLWRVFSEMVRMQGWVGWLQSSEGHELLCNKSII